MYIGSPIADVAFRKVVEKNAYKNLGWSLLSNLGSGVAVGNYSHAWTTYTVY